ncbi:glycerophosphodiester phosphodiesterase family protein [Tropicimonas isoalkanivorans]|uniref:Glycerophosphoryl diester phosphodiesterase n=1 Tax=Tropicimonas isoalkanivorans TaxID=441112 RepID=A0A1I1NX26_9RHOB|nr:glycerophosphodiester phosphodiesterase family protein [Tropicimonas isoalkanivorans]SFD02224.1 Glycerophosphoryl diester phosphodiesterase [Tropicimonas isoalkanivorans]
MSLPASFLDRPIAHRALHDLTDGRPENSRAAVRAAIEGNYGIEVDLQLTSDGQAVVFHDEDLARLTGQAGMVRGRTAAELSRIPLLGGDEGIPTFREILDLVGGRVPLLVEIKDQDGALGPDVGPLEAAAAEVSKGYAGPLAFMSFNPHSMIGLGRIAPETVRGLTTCGFFDEDWPDVPGARRERLADIADLDAAGGCFISHHATDLDRPAVRNLRSRGVPVLCWTIRSPEEEAAARLNADNVTFEGYLAA